MIRNVHMLVDSALPVELAWAAHWTLLHPGSLLNWFQKGKEEAGTCTGKLNLLPPECELIFAGALCSDSSLSHLRVLLNRFLFLDLWKNSSSVISSRVQESGVVSTPSNITSCGSWSPPVRTSHRRYQRPHHMVIRPHQKERANRPKMSNKRPGVFMGLSITVWRYAC